MAGQPRITRQVGDQLYILGTVINLKSNRQRIGKGQQSPGAGYSLLRGGQDGFCKSLVAIVPKQSKWRPIQSLPDIAIVFVIQVVVRALENIAMVGGKTKPIFDIAESL